MRLFTVLAVLAVLALAAPLSASPSEIPLQSAAENEFLRFSAEPSEAGWALPFGPMEDICFIIENIHDDSIHFPMSWPIRIEDADSRYGYGPEGLQSVWSLPSGAEARLCWDGRWYEPTEAVLDHQDPVRAVYAGIWTASPGEYRAHLYWWTGTASVPDEDWRDDPSLVVDVRYVDETL